MINPLVLILISIVLIIMYLIMYYSGSSQYVSRAVFLQYLAG